MDGSGGLAVRGPLSPWAEEQLFTPAALHFLHALCTRFEPERRALLQAREARDQRYLAGERPQFLATTRAVREASWRVPAAPADLQDRRVEITGPPESKLMINALNSGARVFMADLEDATSPTWANVLTGQRNLYDAVRRQLQYEGPDGRRYALAKTLATLVVRPRGWHLDEAHLRCGGAPVSASLVDFGLYFFHNAHELLRRGSGPYFYLPKLESHAEARLWNAVFVHSQEALGLPVGTIRATVLIETLPAAFEMEEILFELGAHATGLNAGRWDYIFSLIKTLGHQPDFLLPDRAHVTMEAPFMQAYCRLLVDTCHRRGAHAIGGMSAFIPNRRDRVLNARALEQVRADKRREAALGFDGTWVAHPDLVPVAQQEFDQVLGAEPHQLRRLPTGSAVREEELLGLQGLPGALTEVGVVHNMRVALLYLAEWLAGRGAVPINNLMEDVATAEIARAQIWQWLHVLAGGTERGQYQRLRDLALAEIHDNGHLSAAADLLDELVLPARLPSFLTIPAYQRLLRSEQVA